MLQEQENHSQQSPSASNSDLNSLASEDEDEESRNDNLTVNRHSSTKANVLREHDFIDDHHHIKQIQRMRTAPPAPPLRKPSHVLQSASRQAS